MTDPVQDTSDITLGFYNANVDPLTAQYAPLDFRKVLSGVMDKLPELRALDIACGIGREAKGLAGMGFRVDAVDGSEGMVARAREINADPRINYGVDRMPDLTSIRAQGHKYDLITMSAAWMHLNEPQRWRMFETLMAIAKPGATMFITLRHGVTDPKRPMYDVNAEELKQMAARGLVHFEHTNPNKDELGRGNVWWDAVRLNVPKDHVEALPVFRNDIIGSAKNSTYKLGLAHCLTSLLKDQPGLVTEVDDARIAIPMAPILTRWAKLYDGLAQEGLPQIHAQQRFGNTLNVTRRFASAVSTVKPSDLESGRVFEGQQAREVQRMLSAARRSLIDGGPVEHITRRVSGLPVFEYQPGKNNAQAHLEIGSDEMNSRFGSLIMARDIAGAAAGYAPLIDAGVRDEWIRFVTNLSNGQRAEVGTRLERALQAA